MRKRERSAPLWRQKLASDAEFTTGSGTDYPLPGQVFFFTLKAFAMKSPKIETFAAHVRRNVPLRFVITLLAFTAATSIRAHVYQPHNGIPTNVLEYVRQHLPAAKKIAKEYGIPVPVILAMGGLETGWGRSELARLD